MVQLATPRACTRGKQHCPSQILQLSPPVPEILASLQAVSINKQLNIASVCFKSPKIAYKSCIFISHAYRPHLVMPRALLIVHAWTQNGPGKYH